MKMRAFYIVRRSRRFIRCVIRILIFVFLTIHLIHAGPVVSIFVISIPCPFTKYIVRYTATNIVGIYEKWIGRAAQQSS